jgi:hypothetical protein
LEILLVCTATSHLIGVPDPLHFMRTQELMAVAVRVISAREAYHYCSKARSERRRGRKLSLILKSGFQLCSVTSDPVSGSPWEGPQGKEAREQDQLPIYHQ